VQPTQFNIIVLWYHLHSLSIFDRGNTQKNSQKSTQTKLETETRIKMQNYFSSVGKTMEGATSRKRKFI